MITQKFAQMPSKYLLILGCSKRKNQNLGLLPAIERYNGINYQVLRKVKREGFWPRDLDVMILSAKYGLIDQEMMIEDYNLYMTTQRAIELGPLVKPLLAKRVKSSPYLEIFVNIGRAYQMMIENWETDLGRSIAIIYANGKIGQRASQMRQWLLEKNEKC